MTAIAYWVFAEQRGSGTLKTAESGFTKGMNESKLKMCILWQFYSPKFWMLTYILIFTYGELFPIRKVHIIIILYKHHAITHYW